MNIWVLEFWNNGRSTIIVNAVANVTEFNAFQSHDHEIDNYVLETLNGDNLIKNAFPAKEPKFTTCLKGMLLKAMHNCNV